MIGGFAMSFGAGRICRYCMATHSEMKKNFSESDFVLRNVDVHRYHLECVKQNPENKGMYGVCGGCVFDQLDYFDVTTSLPPDVRHDFLEGVAPLVLRLVVYKAHQEKHITIQELNDELRKMSIGQNDKTNKPVAFSENILRESSVFGSTSQKWCLFHLLPFLMAHRVPEGCSYWRIYLLCREIADIVMAPVVKKTVLLLLD